MRLSEIELRLWWGKIASIEGATTSTASIDLIDECRIEHIEEIRIARERDGVQIGELRVAVERVDEPLNLAVLLAER